MNDWGAWLRKMDVDTVQGLIHCDYLITQQLFFMRVNNTVICVWT